MRYRRHWKHVWKMGFMAAASLIWLIARSGSKPSRIVYPCQKAAVGNIHVFLLVLFAPFVDLKKSKNAFSAVVNRRVFQTVLLASFLLVAFEFVPLTIDYSPVNYDYRMPIDLRSHVASPAAAADLFIMQNASGFEGNMDAAFSALLQLMDNHGLFLFKTSDHPSGLISKDDVVLIKVNCQWDQRGGTSTDLIKSIIEKIVNHPNTFVGEIVVADNGQFRGSLDWENNNAFNHYQSMVDVVEIFPSHNVSVWLWDDIRSNTVEEYVDGDFNDGYVVNSTQNPTTHVRVSYPKFKTKFDTYVSFKHGIWNNATGIYDFEKLRVINVPVLKSHGSYGVTACVKHYMGVVSQPLTSTHSVIGDGALGTVMVEARLPVLNVVDAIWVNANPMGTGSCGPYTSYSAASYANMIGASVDPVALDYWMSKHVLVPTAIQMGYTSYSSLDPDYVLGPFHNYLANSMNELKRAGIQATMNEVEMNVYVSIPSSTLPGDINLDHKVDIYDAILLAAAYGSTPGDPNWHSNADLNGDDDVDIYDAIILSTNFGQN